MLLAGIRCCILLAPESTWDNPLLLSQQPLGGPGGASGEKQRKRKPRLSMELGVEARGSAPACPSAGAVPGQPVARAVEWAALATVPTGTR